MFVLHLQLQDPASQDLHADKLPNVLGSQLHAFEVALKQLQDVVQLPDIDIGVAVENGGEVTFEEFGGMRKRSLDKRCDVVQANGVFGIDCYYFSDDISNDALVQLQRDLFEPRLKDGLQEEPSLGSRRQLAEQIHRLLVVRQLPEQLDGLLLELSEARKHFAQMIDGIQVPSEDVLQGLEDEYLSDDVGLDLNRLALAVLLIVGDSGNMLVKCLGPHILQRSRKDSQRQVRIKLKTRFSCQNCSEQSLQNVLIVDRQSENFALLAGIIGELSHQPQDSRFRIVAEGLLDKGRQFVHC